MKEPGLRIRLVDQRLRQVAVVDEEESNVGDRLFDLADNSGTGLVFGTIERPDIDIRDISKYRRSPV